MRLLSEADSNISESPVPPLPRLLFTRQKPYLLCNIQLNLKHLYYLHPSLPSPAFPLFYIYLFLKQILDTELSVGQKDKHWSGVCLLCKN